MNSGIACIMRAPMRNARADAHFERAADHDGVLVFDHIQRRRLVHIARAGHAEKTIIL